MLCKLIHYRHNTNANTSDVLRSKQKRPAHMRITMNHLVELVSFTLRIASIAEELEATFAKCSTLGRDMQLDIKLARRDLVIHQQQMNAAMADMRAKVADWRADMGRAKARVNLLNAERGQIVLEEAAHRKALEEHAMSHVEREADAKEDAAEYLRLCSTCDELYLQLANTQERLEANYEAIRSFHNEVIASDAEHLLLTDDASTRYDELADEGQAAQEAASARQDRLQARMDLIPGRVLRLKKSLAMAKSRRESGVFSFCIVAHDVGRTRSDHPYEYRSAGADSLKTRWRSDGFQL